VTPRPGARLFVYQTDADGYYSRPRNDARRARLRGWVEADAAGRYAIATIMPGHYPGQQIPAHIHVHLYAPGLAPHWLDDFVFAGDPYLPGDEDRAGRHQHVVALKQGNDAIVRGTRDIRIDPKLAADNQLVDGWYAR